MTAPPRAREGFTLIEVVIAILLLAMMTAPIMATALAARAASGREERRLAAASAASRVAEHLRAYVTDDPAAARGPGIGPDGWSLPGDKSGLRALEAGHHELEPAQWASALAPYAGAVSYDVTVRATPSGPQPDAVFRVDWREP